MYVQYVCTVCMYSMYVQYVCTVCMYMCAMCVYALYSDIYSEIHICQCIARR